MKQSGVINIDWGQGSRRRSREILEIMWSGKKPSEKEAFKVRLG